VDRDGHPVLTSDVAGRFLDLAEDTFEFEPKRTHDLASVSTNPALGDLGVRRPGSGTDLALVATHMHTLNEAK